MMRNGRRQGVGEGRTLDLFSGCGGLSLGFRTAGFGILGGVEIDADAAATHGANFHPGDPRHGTPLDVHLRPRDLLAELGHDAGERVEVLIGGPPCQAFARVGRAKLRSESIRRNGHRDHRAWLEDPRANLYARYLQYVDTLQPMALLMENVPDVLNHGGVNVAEEICEELDRHGYEAAYTLLNAVHYGVPQMRERMFLLAYRKDLRVGSIRWPDPTHRHDLPPGYSGTRSCALRPIRDGSQGTVFGRQRLRYDDFIHSPSDSLPPAVTARDALADLPAIPARELMERGELRRGARTLNRKVPYPRKPQHAYARLMRSWPGFESVAHVAAHEIRYLPRDYRIFASLAPGDQYPQAHQRALGLFQEHLATLTHPPGPGSARFRQLFRTMVPPYDPCKFPNKWRKMESDAPARTLMAHLGKDSYSHIHYDSAQARTISVREAARLQSFPDAFVLHGSMNAGFRQLGNAVPPLLAYAIARQVRRQLGLRQRPDIRHELARTTARSAASNRR